MNCFQVQKLTNILNSLLFLQVSNNISTKNTSITKMIVSVLLAKVSLLHNNMTSLSNQSQRKLQNPYTYYKFVIRGYNSVSHRSLVILYNQNYKTFSCL